MTALTVVVQVIAVVVSSTRSRAGVETVLCRSIVTPCPLAQPPAPDAAASDAGDDVEREATPEEAAAAVSGYVENVTLKGDADGNIEL